MVKIVRDIKEILKENISRNDSVLDIGCMGDYKSEWKHGFIKEISRKAVGIDPNKQYFDEVIKKNFEIYPCRFEDFEYREKFDVIFAGEVIEHIPDQGRFVEKCRSLLKQNGRLIITTPNSYYITDILNILIRGKSLRRDKLFEKVNGVYLSGHCLIHNFSTLNQLLHTYNMQITRVYYLDKVQRYINPIKGILSSFLHLLKKIRPEYCMSIIVVAIKK